MYEPKWVGRGGTGLDWAGNGRAQGYYGRDPENKGMPGFQSPLLTADKCIASVCACVRACKGGGEGRAEGGVGGSLSPPTRPPPVPTNMASFFSFVPI